MDKTIKAILCFLLIYFSSIGVANAFKCTSNGQSIIVDVAPTDLYAAINGVTLNKNVSDILLTDMSSYTTCSGLADSYYQNAVRTTSLTLADALTSRGYSGYVVSGGTSSAGSICIWPDNQCSMNGTATAPVNAQIHISRPTGSGAWGGSGTTIPAGTEIARLEAEARDVGSLYVNNPWHPITWIFQLQSDMVIPGYTCNIDYYDATVNLPKVDRWDMVKHGSGRYEYASAPFKFNLSCEQQTVVSIKFEGTVMNGESSVLSNSLSGNDNIGIQIEFNDAEVELNSLLKVVENAQDQETLNFKAYYYYRGGNVNPGEIKAVATYLFSYE